MVHLGSVYYDPGTFLDIEGHAERILAFVDLIV
jgi:hypothetical protein